MIRNQVFRILLALLMMIGIVFIILHESTLHLDHSGSNSLKNFIRVVTDRRTDFETSTVQMPPNSQSQSNSGGSSVVI